MSDKYMKEIEDILKQADGMLPKDRPRPAVGQPKPSGRSSNLLSRITGGRGLRISARQLMLTSLGLFLLALILATTKIGFVMPLVIAAVVLFVVAWVLFFMRPVSFSSYEKLWRGRPIEEKLSMWDRFRRWLRG